MIKIQFDLLESMLDDAIKFFLIRVLKPSDEGSVL